MDDMMSFLLIPCDKNDHPPSIPDGKAEVALGMINGPPDSWAARKAAKSDRLDLTASECCGTMPLTQYRTDIQL